LWKGDGWESSERNATGERQKKAAWERDIPYFPRLREVRVIGDSGLGMNNGHGEVTVKGCKSREKKLRALRAFQLGSAPRMRGREEGKGSTTRHYQFST
jgi:hypothetical protein